MNDITQAIADRQSQIERLQAEISALNDVEKMLGGAAPPSRPAAARRSPRRRKSPVSAAPASAPAPAAGPQAKPKKKRRQMTAEERKAVSERMTAYWAERRKKAGK